MSPQPRDRRPILPQPGIHMDLLCYPPPPPSTGLPVTVPPVLHRHHNLRPTVRLVRHHKRLSVKGRPWSPTRRLSRSPRTSERQKGQGENLSGSPCTPNQTNRRKRSLEESQPVMRWIWQHLDLQGSGVVYQPDKSTPSQAVKERRKARNSRKDKIQAAKK